jgi:CcmD family protein
MINTYPDLFWGYTAIWIILTGYIFSLNVRLAKLEKHLKNDRVAEKDPKEADVRTP